MSSATNRFPDALIERLANLREVVIETRGRRSGQQRRATIWIVMDGDWPIVRSEFGDAGNWYRNALADPRIALWVDRGRHPALAARIVDPERLHRVTGLFREKYRGHSALPVMIRPEVEPMTLVLQARADEEP